MKTHIEPVRLTPSTTASSDSRIVKSVALFAFRGLRSMIDAVSEVPDLVSQAASDISDAWEESGRPKS
jgi:hypothetical protein